MERLCHSNLGRLDVKLEHDLCADPSNDNHESIKDTPESTVDKHVRVSNSVNKLVIVLCNLPKTKLHLKRLIQVFFRLCGHFFSKKVLVSKFLECSSQQTSVPKNWT